MSDLALESGTVEDPWKFLEEELLKFQTVVKELEELGESLQELELAKFFGLRAVLWARASVG